MKLVDADAAARWVLDQLRPLCARVEVAGSVRRRCPEVRDLEVVCLPSVMRYLEFQAWVKTLPSVKGQPDGKYTRRKLVRLGCELDLFICSDLTWACNLMIRTGSREFSQAMMLVAQERRMRFRDARLWGPDGKPLQVREERDVFEALNVPWHEPRARTEQAAEALLGRHVRRPRAEEDWLLR